MSREIRRVPPDWDHPRNDRGHFQPLYDQDYQTASQSWKAGFAAWEVGTHPDRAIFPDAEYWEIAQPPDPETHRPAWTPEQATAYQFYEATTEGTPLSPVFQTRNELAAWLIANEGVLPNEIDGFIDYTWNPAAWAERQTSSVSASSPPTADTSADR